MKIALISLLALGNFLPLASAEEVFRIEIGKDYQKYSDSDLRRRVWELERAVWQLQQRVFQLEANKSAPPPADSWICTVKAMGETYTGTGPTKAVASAKALENCRNANDGKAFFCQPQKCEQ